MGLVARLSNLWATISRFLGFRGSRRYLARAALLTCLGLVSIAAVDLIAAGINRNVNDSAGLWRGGARAISHWTGAEEAKGGLRATSRDLRIRIKDHRLTARYTMVAPVGSKLANVALTGMNIDRDGSDLASNALGAIEVAEFRYGLIGSHYARTNLVFGEPRLDISGRKVVVTLYSEPLPLFMNRQYIYVNKPAGITVKGPDQIRVMAASLQVPYATGKVLRDVDNGEAHVQRYGGFVNLTVTEGDGGGWLDGLREVGGINIPVASALLVRLSVLFIYFILFCALAFPDKDFHDNLSIALFRRVLLTIVTALTVVALLGFALDLSTALWRDPGVQAYISAGPLGLLIGGAMLLWLRACWRIGTDNTRRKRRRSLRIKGVLAAYVLTLAVVLVVYGLALKALQVNLLSHWAVVPIGTILLSACIPILVTQLLGDHRLTSYLVSAGLLAAALTATIIWPYLWYSGFKSANGQLLVNAVGKYVYLTAASLTIIGLCILFWRATTKLVSKERRWLRSLLRLMTIGIGIAGLWDVAANADISDPHSSGSDALNLFGLFDALPQLLDWMLIVLTIVVLIRLPATPSARRVARRIAAPVLVLILYWNGTWLYLPVTFALGLVLVTRVLLPQKLLSKTRRARPPEESLEDAIVAWRRADFAAGQQKALAGATDALRDLLVKGDSQGYRRGYETIGKAQEDLAREHDDFERKARAAKNTAFNHNGEILDWSTAATGAVLGAVFGIIPATVSLLTSQPPDNSGYPMLDFLGSTAWTLLFWPTIGWFVGYLLPLIRGDNGTEKALWIFFVAVAAGLPMDIIWNSGHDWTLELLNTLELFAFFMLLTVSLSDLKTLRAAGMNATDWVRVHNWRFTVTWSTALIAAIGTAAVTFLSSAAADFSNQTVANITGPSSGQAGNHAP